MAWLILGLVIFLGVHSVRIVAEGWRSQVLSNWGEAKWTGICSLLSVVGFGLIVLGFGDAPRQPVVLWVPHVTTRHAAALLVLNAFVLMVATYVPGNAIKSKLRHPMVLSVKVWTLAHSLANGTVADALLF